MEIRTISTLHNEHMQWLNLLEFYKDDIKILQKRIEEVAARNSDKEVLAYIEHFQNMLIMQKEKIDELSHDIRDHEKYLSQKVDVSHSKGGNQSALDHPEHRQKIKDFEKSFADMRLELLAFASRWM